MSVYWIRKNLNNKTKNRDQGHERLPTMSILYNIMKNNIKPNHVICMIACFMALANIHYSNLSKLDIAVIIVVIIAIVSIIANVILNRKGDI